MKATIIKGTVGLLGASGLGVGGYYGFKTITKREKNAPVVTAKSSIKDLIIKEGYTPFNLDAEGWKSKFGEFKENDAITSSFAQTLKAKFPDLNVTKGQDSKDGGSKLSEWCSEVLELKEEDESKHKTLANAKAFCATAPTTSKVTGP